MSKSSLFAASVTETGSVTAAAVKTNFAEVIRDGCTKKSTGLIPSEEKTRPNKVINVASVPPDV